MQKTIIESTESIQVPASNCGKYILDHLRNAKPLDVCLQNYNTGEQLTYAEIIEYAVSLSVALSEFGVGKGDIVAVGSEARIMFLPTTLAVLLTGAAYTPFYLSTGRAVLRHNINMSMPNYFICSESFWEAYSDIIKGSAFVKTVICFEDFEEIEHSIKKMISKVADIKKFEPATVEGQTDTAVVLYSSGTTGMPKGVPLTHYFCILNSMPYTVQDEYLKTVLVFGEWYHAYDIFKSYAVLCAGKKIVFSDTQSSYQPEHVLKFIQDCQVNLAAIVPSTLSTIAKTEQAEKYDLSSLKVIFSSASALPPTIIETIKRKFPALKNLFQIYGMTEAGAIASEQCCTKGLKAGSVGVACPGATLKVVDPKTREILGANQRGEICVRGPIVMKGYIGMDSSACFDQEGYFLTGDLGYYDEDSYFYIVDRMKDLIFYDGEQVAPLQLESILMSHPDVRVAAVIGKPVDDFGKVPVAFVVKQPGSTITEQQLIDYVSYEENYNTREQLTYAEFIERSVSVSVTLSKQGITKGDIVAVGSEKCISFLHNALAVVFTGAALTPFDLNIGKAKLRHELNLARPNYIICTTSFWKAYGDLIRDCEFIKTTISFEDTEGIDVSIQKLSNSVKIGGFEPASVEEKTDVAMILFSCGTTGSSKGVFVSHLSCVLNCSPERFQDESLRTVITCGEWCHRYDMFNCYSALCAGRKIVFADNLTHDSIVLPKIIQDCKVNIAMIVPSMVSYLADAEEVDEYDLSSLKEIVHAALSLPSKIYEKVKARILTVKNVTPIYGMTEVGVITSGSGVTKGPKPGSVGMASPGMTLKIVDPKSREILGTNQQGEICIRGPHLMNGYIGVDSSAYLDKEGFFLTGDLGYFDEDAYFYIVDRLKEMLNFDGFTVSPSELESVLLLHPDVREAVVMGKAAGVYGELPTAFVVKQSRSALTEEQLQDFVVSQVPPYMQLRGGVKFISEIPRSVMGKIIRKQLKELL